MIGVFGWLGPPLPHWIRDTYWAALGLTAVLDGGKPLPLNLRAKAVAWAAYLFTFAVMATFVYLSWEAVGCQSIEGIQSRYFLPIIPLLLLLPPRCEAGLQPILADRRAGDRDVDYGPGRRMHVVATGKRYCG